MSAPRYLYRMLDPISRCLTPEVASRLAQATVNPAGCPAARALNLNGEERLNLRQELLELLELDV